MRFANPHFLWVLLLVPFLAGLLAWSQSRRRKALERYAQPAMLARFGVLQPGWRGWVSPGLAVLAVTLLIVSTARPQWGFEDRRVISRGVDVIIAVDTSTSMLAQDYKPNRLQRAKELLQNILWEVKGDRVGIMAFAGNAVILCPLTLDYSMASTALESVSVNTVPTQGTGIGLAIDAATKAFEAASAGERVLVLLTDGEDQGTEPIAAAQRAANAKVKVLALGIGNTDGTPIPVNGGYKQDRSGKVVNTKLDFQTLTEVARLTGGRAIKANLSGGAEVSNIMAELGTLKGTDQQDRIYRVYKERYAWFLAPAVLLLLIEALGIGRPRRGKPLVAGPMPPPTPRKKSAVAAALLMFGLLAALLPAGAQAYPGEAQVLARKGMRQYNEKKFDEANQSFAAAAERAQEDQILKYNKGAAAWKANKPDEAVNAFGSVYDPENPAVSAAAEYNIGRVEQQAVRREIEAKFEDWQQKVAQGDEAVREEIKKQMQAVEKVMDRYKSSLLKVPDDRDVKQNYEVAHHDLERLKKLLEQSDQQQQQQQQQNQEQQQNNQQNQEQGNKGEQQQQQPQQQGQDQKQDQQQSDQKQDEQKQDEQQNQSHGKQDQQQQQNPGDPKQDQQGEGEEQDEKATPTPQPTATPNPSPTPGKGKPQPSPAPDDEPKNQGEEPVEIGQMEKGDVERLLNSLPAENDRALQRFLNSNYKMRDDMENDW